MKLTYPHDTRDELEIISWPFVKSMFQGYGRFWQDFIGVYKEDGLLWPYGLKKDEQEISKNAGLYKAYYRMCMVHYSILCDLMATHVLIADLIRVITLRPTTVFSLWQIFEHIYFRLGSARLRWETLHDTVEEIGCYAKQFPIEKVAKKDFEKSFKRFLKDEKDESAVKLYHKYKSSCSATRNNLVHFARQGGKVWCGTIYVPKEVVKNPVWFQEFDILQDGISIEEKARSDFMLALKWLPGLHEFVAKRFQEILDENNIEICYEKGQQLLQRNNEKNVGSIDDGTQVADYLQTSLQKSSAYDASSWGPCLTGMESTVDNVIQINEPAASGTFFTSQDMTFRGVSPVCDFAEKLQQEMLQYKDRMASSGSKLPPPQKGDV
ncbi:MAG: hypothetical protein ABIH04_02025 [Planctomycetota bacterium]